MLFGRSFFDDFGKYIIDTRGPHLWAPDPSCANNIRIYLFILGENFKILSKNILKVRGGFPQFALECCRYYKGSYCPAAMPSLDGTRMEAGPNYE